MNNKILSLIKLLPKELIDYIYEYNPDHRSNMKNIINEIDIRNYCLFCNKRIKDIIHILPNRRHLCNNICYRKFRKEMNKNGISFI